MGGRLAFRQTGLEGASRNYLPPAGLVILTAFLADFFFFRLLLRTSGDGDSTALPAPVHVLTAEVVLPCV